MLIKKFHPDLFIKTLICILYRQSQVYLEKNLYFYFTIFKTARCRTAKFFSFD